MEEHAVCVAPLTRNAQVFDAESAPDEVERWPRARCVASLYQLTR
jgi:hypothetical protein